MAEDAVGARDAAPPTTPDHPGPGPAAFGPWHPDDDPHGLSELWPARRPAPVVVKRDLLPAVGVFGVIALCGLALGFLWSRLAPAELVQIVDGGRLIPLRSESHHRFDDLVLFVLMAMGAGLVTGAAVWALRERRGPVYLIAATGGAALAAWLATRVGVSWAEAHYPVPAAPALGDVLTLAPRLESAWAFVAWPFGTALAYGLAAAWNGMDDLGRRLG
ncbi:DUF2567 domain-containing protein [Actinokineospora sp. PR83]|uniref:DUF2567 domain-containing protein n=1 Tax=Actinokineospora sp. PR83 TaxID=2884908 RepID=UPI0027DFBDF2|nr:DUF2567 domain-containing protein [Actinokineospora sp. PR83]MCG8914645.1 DUF2567 domain-containing protein [Actinokineospora sp. PR83]